jgi:hypothetical protein
MDFLVPTNCNKVRHSQLLSITWVEDTGHSCNLGINSLTLFGANHLSQVLTITKVPNNNGSIRSSGSKSQLFGIEATCGNLGL